MNSHQEQLLLADIAKLQKELKEKNLDLDLKKRELEIEGSLEKVRTVTLAIKKPDDILDVCKVMFKEMKSLGFSDLRNTLINFWDDANSLLIDYDYSDYTGGNKAKLSYSTHPVFEQFLKEIKQSKDAFSNLVIKGEQLESWKQRRRESGEYVDPRLDHISSLYYYFYSIGVGAIGISTFNALSADNLNLLKRFRNVFDLAYRRYKDVEKAEAQAREAQIEAALEKVRSTSLAMQKSHELQNVITIVFEKLRELGLSFEDAGIQLYSVISNDIFEWVAAPDQLSAPTYVNLPFSETDYHESEMFRDILNAKTNGENIFNKTYSLDEKNKYFYYIGKYNDSTQVPEEVRKFQNDASRYTISLASQQNSAVWLDSWSGQTISIEDFEILKRVAKVFEQAYTRFQDLENAEAQAREAQIETALEKVRSRSLAMYHSDELEQVVASLFDRLIELGLSFDGALIFVFEREKRNIKLWIATKQLSAPVEIDLPYDKEIANNAIIKDLWKAIESGEHIFNRSYSGETKNEYFRYVVKYNESKIPESVRRIQIEKDNWTAFFATSKNSIIGFDSWSGHITSDEDFKILIRFSKVFEQAYTRFLDLQKAEAQAREAQIEAALEKVRSKAMAMHTSEELIEVAKELRKQVGLLGTKDLETCAINLYEESDEYINAWTAVRAPESKNEIVELHFNLPKKGIYIIEDMLQAYSTGVDEYTFELAGEKGTQWMKTIEAQLPDLFAAAAAGQEFKNTGVVRAWFTCCYFPGGALIMITMSPADDQSRSLLKRFSQVFGMAYRRFADLKKAEAQAVEANMHLLQIEAEKTRAETALKELQGAQAQLIQAEKMASLGELTAGIAHEIQNPLNFVNNFSEVNKELTVELEEEINKGNYTDAKVIAKDIRENEEKINHHGKRADAIVKGMLQHSRSSDVQKELTDINALADEYLRLAYHGLRAKNKTFNATLKTDYDESIGNINIIPQDIGRVILNLITNAFYAVNEKKILRQAQDDSYEPTVSVSTKKLDDRIEIHVTDNGNGIPANVFDKIFQPFFTTKPTGQGTGLGLSLAYDIIKAHGGVIKVNTKEREGSEFIIQLRTN